MERGLNKSRSLLGIETDTDYRQKENHSLNKSRSLLGIETMQPLRRIVQTSSLNKSRSLLGIETRPFSATR